LDDGSGNIGIYSANPTLFSNISYGSNKDKALVQKARENGKKETLVFGLPKPTITTSKGDNKDNVSARFELKGNTLTVVAEGLNSLKKPFSIDPSVVITTATDFSTDGNNEGNISFGSGDASRGGLAGGTLASWSTDATDPTPTTGSSGTKTVFYNGYYYIFNLYSQASVYYAAAQPSGDIGSWTPTTNVPNTGNNVNPSFAAYNGYLYMTQDGVSSAINTATHYIKINANGSLGASWSTGPNLNTARGGGGTAAYNGRLYVVGGCSAFLAICTAETKTSEYATINPDGSLSAWTTTTSSTNNHSGAPVQAYNGYMYAMGSGGSGTQVSIEYAPINSDGSLGTWVVNSNSLITAAQQGRGIIVNGYLYYGPGTGQTQTATIQYAPIYASGAVGPLQQTTTLPAARYGSAMASDGKGHIVLFGGTDGTNPVSSIYYTTINSAGVINSYVSSANFIVATEGRDSAATVAYNGYMYVIGGRSYNGVLASTNTILYAPIQSTGDVGTT
jgi:hypothetical protein